MDVVPYGLIGNKWHELGAENGFFGRPLEAEHGVPDPNQPSPRVQRFERGTIAWTPAQGPSMIVSIYRVEGSPRGAMLMWGPTDPFNYDRFIVRWQIDNEAWQQADVTNGPRNSGVFGPITSAAHDEDGTIVVSSRYHVRCIVEGYDNDGNARQGWTIPVQLEIY